jgi:hypothetical protein
MSISQRRRRTRKAKKNLSRATSAAKYLTAAKATIGFLEDRLPTKAARQRRQRRSLRRPALIAGALALVGGLVAKKRSGGGDFDVAGATPTPIPTPAPAPAEPTGEESSRTGGGQGTDTPGATDEEQRADATLVEAAETGAADGHGA